MGIGDTKLTYATGLNFGLENEKPFEVDFTFGYQRDHLLDHAEEPALVFGEAKSFAVGSLEAKDITRMTGLAEKFPGAFLVFALLKDTLAEHEKAEIAALATWDREELNDGCPRAPVIVLTGTELFSEWTIQQTWRALSDKRGQRCKLIEQLTAPHPRGPEGEQPFP